jgi:ribonuclease HI
MTGLGIHVGKTVVLAGRQEDIPSSTELLQASTWPQVRLVNSSVYLGITIGPKVTPTDIFTPFLSGFRKRLDSLKPYLLRMKVYDRTLVCNTYLIPMLAYPMRYYLMPKSLIREAREALRRICTPFNGSAHPYEFLTLPTKSGGLSTPLRCIETYNDSLLASVSPLIKATGSLWDLPDPVPDGCFIEDTSIISVHRDAACVDFLCHHYGEDDRLLPLPCTSSKVIYDIYVSYTIKAGALSTIGNKIRQRLQEAKCGIPGDVTGSYTANVGSLPKGTAKHVRYTHLCLIANSLPTKRRTCSFRGSLRSRSDPMPCPLCLSGTDSIAHFFSSDCSITQSAFVSTFVRLGLPLPLEPTFAVLLLAVRLRDEGRVGTVSLIISFVWAVWFTRIARAGAASLCSPQELTEHVVMLSISTALRSMRYSPSTGLTPRRAPNSVPAERLIPDLSPTGIVAYTVGGCRGRQAQCGAAAVVIVPAALTGGTKVEFLLSASLGPGTRSVGEVWAIGLALEFCRDRSDLLEGTSGLHILSDSVWAANTAQGKWKARSIHHVALPVRDLSSLVGSKTRVTYHHCPDVSGARAYATAYSLITKAIKRAALEGKDFTHHSIANCDPNAFSFNHYIVRRIPSDYG